MKKLATLILALMAFLPAFAQGKYGSGQDSVDCVTNLNYYRQYLQQNDMADAISPWRKAIVKCPPTASQNMFIDGARLMRWAYAQAKDAARRNEILDSLVNLYDVRAQAYPKNAVTAMNNKAIDMVNYKWRSNEPLVLFNHLKRVVDMVGSKTSPMVLATYMQTGVDLYKNGLRDFNNVLDAQRSRLNLEEELAISRGQITVDLIELYRSLGGGLASDVVFDCGCEDVEEKETEETKAE